MFDIFSWFLLDFDGFSMNTSRDFIQEWRYHLPDALKKPFLKSFPLTFLPFSTLTEALSISQYIYPSNFSPNYSRLSSRYIKVSLKATKA